MKSAGTMAVVTMLSGLHTLAQTETGIIDRHCMAWVHTCMRSLTCSASSSSTSQRVYVRTAMTHCDCRYDGSQRRQEYVDDRHRSRSLRPEVGFRNQSRQDPSRPSSSPSSPASRPSPSSSASPQSRGAAHNPQLALPEGFRNGRIFWSRCAQQAALS